MTPTSSLYALFVSNLPAGSAVINKYGMWFLDAITKSVSTAEKREWILKEFRGRL